MKKILIILCIMLSFANVAIAKTVDNEMGVVWEQELDNYYQNQDEIFRHTKNSIGTLKRRRNTMRSIRPISRIRRERNVGR